MNKLEKAKSILKTLTDAGFKAWLIGGCVRDYLMQREPNDYDIATNALPEQVDSIFFETDSSNKHYGAIKVTIEEEQFEVTTLRKESGYSDYRHPTNVEFTDKLEEDLVRRDLTINAFAMDGDNNITYIAGGKEDFDNKILRIIGDPDVRFREDPLRMLRVIRFASKFQDFKIEQETYEAIKRNASLIKNISNKRIKDELDQILFNDPVYIDELHKTGLLKEIIPEVDILSTVTQNNRWHYADVFYHTLDALKHTKKYTNLSQHSLLLIRYALMFHDTGKIDTKTVDAEGFEHFFTHPIYSYRITGPILERLGFTTSEIDTITKLVLYHDEHLFPTRKMLLKICNSWNMSLYEYKLLGYIREADISAHVKKENDDRMERYFKLLTMYKQKAKYDKLFSASDLKINGEDIMKAYNIPSGQLVGTIKRDLYEMCFLKPSLNTREYLFAYLEENREKYLDKK